MGFHKFKPFPSSYHARKFGQFIKPVWDGGHWDDCFCCDCDCPPGPPGPRGPKGHDGHPGHKGATGATGATGASGDLAQLRAIQAQLVNGGGDVIADGARIVFDTVNDQSPDITYNALTGEFTLNAEGNYLVTWWVATDGTLGAPNVTFAIRQGLLNIPSSSPLVTGHVSGSAFLTVTSTPAVVTLENNTQDTVLFASTPVQANIIIAKVRV
ncbi:MAG: hypothetical protein ACOYU3_08485 [Bacillota bacterium]